MTDFILIDRNVQAAALCDRAEGRLSAAYSVTGPLGLLAEQWADAQATWDDPDSTAYQVAIGVVTELAKAFPREHPRTVLAAAAALLNHRARALEMGR